MQFQEEDTLPNVEVAILSKICSDTYVAVPKNWLPFEIKGTPGCCCLWNFMFNKSLNRILNYFLLLFDSRVLV